MTARTLFDKLWDTHVIRDLGDGWALLHIDRHLLHAFARVRIGRRRGNTWIDEGAEPFAERGF